MTGYVAKVQPPGGNIEITVSAATMRELAKKLGVCRTTLWRIYYGKGKSIYKIQITKEAGIKD